MSATSPAPNRHTDPIGQPQSAPDYNTPPIGPSRARWRPTFAITRRRRYDLPMLPDAAIIHRPGEVIFDLAIEAPELLACLPEPAAHALGRLRQGQFPAARTIADYDTGRFFRPLRHVRSFYERVGGSAVIAYKGSEAWADDLRPTVREMAEGRSCLNKNDTFIVNEGKIPVAYMTHEALGDARKALSLFSAVRSTFHESPALPLPLLVVQWPERAVSRYRDLVLPQLSATSRAMVERRLANGLAEYVYYFPKSPIRLRHAGVSGRELMANPARTAARVDAWVTLCTQILCSGYLPCVLSNQRCGCCVQDQNVCIDGGFVDVDSVEAIDDDPAMFVPNLLASLQILAHSLLCYLGPALPERLIAPVLQVANGFGDTLHAMLVFPHVWRMVEEKLNGFVAAGIRPDQRLVAIFGAGHGLSSLLEIAKHLTPLGEARAADKTLSAHTTV